MVLILSFLWWVVLVHTLLDLSVGLVAREQVSESASTSTPASLGGLVVCYIILRH